jgi:hypothetical protein
VPVDLPLRSLKFIGQVCIAPKKQSRSKRGAQALVLDFSVGPGANPYLETVPDGNTLKSRFSASRGPNTQGVPLRIAVPTDRQYPL